MLKLSKVVVKKCFFYCPLSSDASASLDVFVVVAKEFHAKF